MIVQLIFVTQVLNKLVMGFKLALTEKNNA